jgi:DNA-directed RNA polymerase subunit M/transcription elongation factor TFIIS
MRNPEEIKRLLVEIDNDLYINTDESNLDDTRRMRGNVNTILELLNQEEEKPDMSCPKCGVDVQYYPYYGGRVDSEAHYFCHGCKTKWPLHKF